jgi:glycine oxidase
MEEPFLFGHQGSLVVAPPEAAKELEEWTIKMSRLFSSTEFRPLSPPQLAELEPAFSGLAHSGLWLANEGYLDPRGALRAIHRTLEKEGAALHFETQVKGLTDRGITANGSLVRYDRVIDARGLGAQADWPELRGVRGEALVVEAPDVKLRYPTRILYARHPIYIVPRGPSSYYVGATTIESASLAPIQVQSLLEILTNLAAFHPGFRYAHVKECIAQVRPTLDDHLPRITIDRGVVRVNGLHRHGFLLSPTMSQAVCDLVLGDPDHERVPKVTSPNHLLREIERITP